MARLTDNQKAIVDFARRNGNFITKKQACDLIPYFNNTQKHVGDVLARMVRSKKLTRVKKGLYSLNLGQQQNIVQSQLFPDEGLFKASGGK